MAIDPVILNPGVGGDSIATDNIGGVNHELVKIEFGAEGAATIVNDADGARLPIKPHMAANASRSFVNDSAVAVSILAANASRKGAIISNSSSAPLFIGFGTVDPTISDYTTIIYQGQTYEVPSCFTGQIKGIWESDPADGGSYVTELT